jgi:hypothetical protein
MCIGIYLIEQSKNLPVLSELTIPIYVSHSCTVCMLVIVCFFLTFYVVPSVLFLQLPHIDLKIRTAVGGHPEPTSAELTSFLF